MQKVKKPTIGITLGDPAGVGPEIIAKSLKSTKIRNLADYVIIGDAVVFKKYFPEKYKNCTFIDLGMLSGKKIKMGVSDKYTAKASLEYLKHSVKILKSKKIKALVTGPVSKEAISSLGKKFQGHTEFLADAFNVKNYDMMFVCDALKTVVVTRHIPLQEVSHNLCVDKILRTIKLADKTLKGAFKIKKPKIAVCGLNPHAGEGGSIGSEEVTTIIPAINKARKIGINAAGPFAADTIFSPDIAKAYDIVITMYHDQGTIPVKTLAFSKLVNFTIGLPFIRTSPAHGTAFNIAGKNKANPDSISAAIRLAARLAQ